MQRVTMAYEKLMRRIVESYETRVAEIVANELPEGNLSQEITDFANMLNVEGD